MSLLNDRARKVPGGRDATGDKKEGYWASSNYDENEKTAKFRDKKFEGYSELRSGYDPSRTGKRDTMGNMDDKALKQLEDEYILNLQKQIALMEQELKLLKEREMEQNKSAAGYEVLLKDGIPVNEHFIALKNKYNLEKDDWEKKLRDMDEDNKTELKNNKEKQNKIVILNHEFEEISFRYNEFKDKTDKRIADYQSRIFNETNLIEKLKREIDELTKKFNELESENSKLERDITKSKMFNKRDVEEKLRKEKIDKLDKHIRELDDKYEQDSMELLRQKTKFEDKDLIKKQNEELLKTEQDHSKLDIEINIAKSKIKELENIRMMNIRILQDIYAEIRDLEKDKTGYETILEKKPESVGDAKFNELMAMKEKERQNELESKIKSDDEYLKYLSKDLDDEEAKARALLEDKNQLENELKLHHIDLEKSTDKVRDNDDERIRLKNLDDMLNTQKEKETADLAALDKENEDYQKKNDELEAENEQLLGKIRIIKQKIDLNTLLREINSEDFRIAAKNNEHMMGLIRRWESLGLDSVDP